MIVVISTLVILILLGAVAGVMLLVIVVIDSHRGSPFRSLADRPPTCAEATARLILGAGAHNKRQGD